MRSVRALAVIAGTLCLLLVQAAGGARARDIIDAPFDAVSIDILRFAEQIQSSANETDVEAAPDVSGGQSSMRLSARSQGPIYRWLVFSIRNSSPIPLEYVVAARHKSFVGSGVIWPEFASRILVDGQASPGLPPTPEQLNTSDGFSFRIDSNQTITYALEVDGDWPDNLRLWQRDAFAAQRQQVSFFHGLLLGIAILVAIYISSLFIIRRKLIFPSAALLAWCSVSYLAIEFGYLPILIDVSSALQIKIRALVETAMAFSMFASLYTFVELRKRMPVAGYMVLLLILGCIALIGYGYNEPIISAGVARMAILGAAVFGLAVVLALSRRGVIRAQVALSAWVLVAIWTVVAALAATGVLTHDMVGPGLAAGIVLVNLMIAFTVTQYAFDAGVISSRFFEDSGRRALALAGSEQSVWDWREDQGWLFVGQELEKALGLRPNSMSSTGLKGWLELMHPGDRPAYVAAVEAAIQRGRGTFAQEFRLRRKDGTYRWYQLRARAVPGEQGRASRCIGTLGDITTYKRSEERMLYDAVQDRLTGLPNRALFMDRLDRAMSRARGDDAVKLFVAVVDLDRFKIVNDGLGHSIGDSLLLTMARRLQKFMGSEDTLARLSGDQFGVIINASRPQREVNDLAEQLRQAVAHPVQLNPREVFLTASIGVSEYTGDINQPLDLLKDAEIALYEAKRRGKNKIEYFRPTMRDDRSKLIEIESDLRRALERNEIEVAYQPIHSMENGELAGFEALVRWRHRRHGLLGPDEFIGVAEETGVIVDLGRYVMSEAARQLGIWQRVLRPTNPIFVSVNLSPHQVLGQNLVDDVKTIMSREDVTEGSLKLELTETMVMENVELSIQVLQKLRDSGVAILCDDFGTGYSSLSLLQRLPFDTIKLDRSFIMAPPGDDAASVILESIILLAHDLNMKVVAEGIESRDQMERLREFECDFGQGYFFGEPLSSRDVIEALGGKSSLVESKKTKSGRGLFGRLLRPSTNAEDEPESAVEEGSRLKTDQPATGADNLLGIPVEADAFRSEVEARRLERLRRPEIGAVEPVADDSTPEEDDAPDDGEEKAGEGSDAPSQDKPDSVAMEVQRAHHKFAPVTRPGEEDSSPDESTPSSATQPVKPEAIALDKTTAPDVEGAQVPAPAGEDKVDAGELESSPLAAGSAQTALSGGDDPAASSANGDAAKDAPPADDDSAPAEAAADDLEEDGEPHSDAERRLEEIANQRRKGSRLGKLLRRSKKKQAELET